MPQARLTNLFLNIGHAIDHLVLLVYATAVIGMAAEFNLSYGEMLPLATGAFVMFGLGSLPAGWLGDHWSRRGMMIVFFFGAGVTTIAVAFCQTPMQLFITLTVLGIFAAIYHPVGIAMLVQDAKKVGITIGINGLAGNLGIAVAAVLSGFLMQRYGWRSAFIAPGVVSIVTGIAFWLLVPKETMAAAKRPKKPIDLPRSVVLRAFAVMTTVAICSSLIFNFTTNALPKVFDERLIGITRDPALLGLLLGGVYFVGSLAQLAIGTLIDRYPLKSIILPVVILQVPMFALAANSQDWMMLVLATGFMLLVFGQIPFGDSMIAQYFDDRMRSRVYAVRLTISFGASAVAINLISMIHATGGFTAVMLTLSVVAVGSFIAAMFLPGRDPAPAPVAQPAE
jgi:MFS family permease